LPCAGSSATPTAWRDPTSCSPTNATASRSTAPFRRPWCSRATPMRSCAWCARAGASAFPSCRVARGPGSRWCHRDGRRRRHRVLAARSRAARRRRGPFRRRPAGRHQCVTVEARAAAWALLRARSFESARLHDWRERRREFGRTTHAQVRHHHQPRTRRPARAPRWRRRATRLADRHDQRPRSAGCRRRQRRHARDRERDHGAPLADPRVRRDAARRVWRRRIRVSCGGAHHPQRARTGRDGDRRPAHDRGGRSERLRRRPAARRRRRIARRAGRCGGGGRATGCADPRRCALGRRLARRRRARRGRARAFLARAQGRLRRDGPPRPDLYVHDAVVPRARLPEVLERICAIADAHGLRLSNVFHAGDGTCTRTSLSIAAMRANSNT